MARRPFFSGNYGSSLGSTAQAADIIARSGQQRGQALAGMGAQIGGMIQQYGLNKEKQKENKATIKSSIGILERMKKLDPKNEPQYLMQIEQLNNEDMGLGMRAKLADKTLQGLSITSRLQSDILNAKGQEQNLIITKENQKIKSDAATAKEKAYKNLDDQIDQIEQDSLNGMSYEDLPPQSRFLLGNKNFVKTRQIPLEDLVYNPREELDDQTARLNFEILQGKKKQQDAETKKTDLEAASIQQDTEDAKAEASILPEFTDKESAKKSIDDLPQGVSASIKKFKNGFNVELQYKAKEFTDIPSVPGFPNYKIVGGYVYEGDPKTKKLTKLGSENFGEKSELLQKTIQALTTKEVEQYALAKFRSKEQNDDGDYEFVDPASGENTMIPFNQDLENRLIYLDELENKLKTQIDLDLRTKR